MPVSAPVAPGVRAAAQPDEWLGRTVTVNADWAPFTEPDYGEACSRLRRLGCWYVLRYYADQVGALLEAQPGAQSRPGGRSMTAGRPHRTATAGSR